jgi:lipopolysaccharide transport system ATP-binding protein
VYHNRITNTIKGGHFNKLRLSPKDKLVLDDISFSFNPGDIIGLIGHNGAGKSTLLSILAGISKPTCGDIDISGKVTAVMTLGVGLRDDLNGRENIYLDGQIQGKTREEISQFIDEIITFADLGAFIDRPVKTYSTGMKSRLAFSMLVGIQPEILIIDEALSAGDAFFAEKASRKIKEICKKGKIVIIVSHSMTTIEAMCNRCIWLEHGKILMDGEPGKVTRSYLQKIRQEDEKQALTKQEAKTSYTTALASYKIRDVSMSSLENTSDSSLFYTKDSLKITGIIERMEPREGLINIAIERLDGFLVSCESFHLDGQLTDPNSSSEILIKVELSLDSLVLNKGHYRLKFEVLEKGAVTSYFIHSFEVKNEQMATGGLSLLHYPAEIGLISEEANLCSDSTELITE